MDRSMTWTAKEVLQRMRYPNLLIICLTQVIFYFGVLKPTYQGVSGLYPTYIFIVASILTMCIAAAGYMINDVFDRRMDQINHPNKNLIDIRLGIRMYVSLFLIGFVLHVFICYQCNLWHLIWIYPMASIGLFAYSYKLKCSGIWGNLLVAIFSAFVIGILLVPVLPVFWAGLMNNDWTTFEVCFLYFFIFSFLVSLIREIVKDIEDYSGDKMCNCNTLAVRLGPGRATFCALFFTVVTVGALVTGLCFVKSMYPMYVFLMGGGFISVSFGYVIALLYRSKKKEDFTYISKLLKVIMILGILFLFFLK